METTLLEKSAVGYVYNNTELSNRIMDTIEKIESWTKKHEYRINGNLNQYKKESDSMLEGISKNQKKKINKYILYLDKHMTLKRVNSFLHLLSKKMKMEKVYIKTSLKEENIQKSRIKMLAARKIYENLLVEYKKEKGDFYKN